MSSVAVVVACFNGAEFLPVAVESALAQTHSDLEVLIVDDGSLDDSRAVAGTLAARDSRVRVFARENGGLPVARNTAIRATTAKYVAALDADDEFTPTYLERCIAALEAHPEVSIAYGGQQNFGADDTFHPHIRFDERYETIENLIGVASVYRRQAWLDVGGYASQDYEDWDFWISCVERGHSALHVPDAVFRYCVRAGSLSEDARRRDAGIKAQIVNNHPTLYTPLQREWAELVLAGDEAAWAVPAPPGRIPTFAGDVSLAGTAIEPLPPVEPADLGEVRATLFGIRLEDLTADPSLLRLYAETVDPDDDATLVVIRERGSDEAALAAIQEAADAVGVALGDLPDVVLAPSALTRPQLRMLSFRLDALLARSRPPQDLGVPPRIDSAEQIRALVAERIAA